MSCFAVLDTETNWYDQVMSLGVVAADRDTLETVDARYYIFTPESRVGGMFYGAMFLQTPVAPELRTREEAMEEIRRWLGVLGIRDLFAYNARLDRGHLPELGAWNWYDIMELAIYRQHNSKIPDGAACYATGRMKRGYGVEPMLRLLSGDATYRETHNALLDAVDELRIMRLLGHPLERYHSLKG